MMKSTELRPQDLRIGNIFYHIKKEIHYGTYYVYEITKDGVANEHGKIIPYDEVKPIPLTEEWLLRFGFVKDDVFDKLFIYLPLNEFCVENLSFRVGNGFICFDGVKYRTLLKHVTNIHTLQNLYFALTNEELTIKP